MLGCKLLPTPLESLFLGLCLLISIGKILGNNGVRVVVKEGSDAVLPCSPINKEDLSAKLFDWKKGGQEVFLYSAGNHYNNGRDGQDQQFRGRVSHFQDQLMNGNASIKINNTKMADSGIYSCIFPRLQPSQTFIIQLVVEPILKDRSGEFSGASKPIITILNETKDRLLLQCEVREASPEPKVEWKDGAGNILPAEEPQVSERGGRYYVTLNYTVTKTGRYRCVVTQEELSHQISAEIYVFISDASPEPYIRTVDATKDWSLLQCEVRGASPKPKVEWQDSSGNILPAEEPQVSERGGWYYVTLNTTVTKTGRYRCVVTQEEISHQTSAETVVFISGKLGEDPSAKVPFGWMVGGIVIGVVILAVVVAAVLKATKCTTFTCNRAVVKLILPSCGKDNDPHILPVPDAAPDRNTTSNDPTKDTPLLEVGVTGEHQHQNGSSIAPAEMPPV